MDKVKLKKVLKQMIKECIKEVLFEEGVLSGIVSEVAQGMAGASVLVEKTHRPAQSDAELERKREALESRRQERIKKLNESASLNLGGVNIFEGTTPIKSSGSPSPHTAPGAMAGVDPNDAGVDITGLAKLAGGSWRRSLENKR